MTLVASAPVQIIATTSARLAGTNTDVATIVYQDNAINENINGVVLNISSGSIVDGTPDGIYTAVGSVGLRDAKQSDTDELLVWVYDGGDSPQHNAIKVARSGDILTPTNLTWDPDDPAGASSGPLGAGVGGNKALIARDYGVAGAASFGYNSVDLITNAVAEMIDQNGGREGDGANFDDVIGMDVDDLMVAFSLVSDSSLFFQMVNVSVGVSQGAESDTTYNSSGVYELRRFDDNKAIAAILLSGNIQLMTVNRSGTSISSYGTPTSVGSAATNAFDVSGSKIILARQTDIDTITIESFTISGDTITDDALDTTIVRANSIDEIIGLEIVDTDQAILVWLEDDSFLYGSIISNLGAASPAASFYQGAGSLTLRFTLPFPVGSPGALALRGDGVVAIGGAAAGSGGELVTRASSADSYAAGTDVTDSLTGAPIGGLGWINGDS